MEWKLTDTDKDIQLEVNRGHGGHLKLWKHHVSQTAPEYVNGAGILLSMVLYRFHTL